jgi:hypothetical protein
VQSRTCSSSRRECCMVRHRCCSCLPACLPACRLALAVTTPLGLFGTKLLGVDRGEKKGKRTLYPMPARLLRRFAPLLGLVIVCALLPLSLEGSSPPPSSPAPRPFVAPPRDPCLYEELGVSHDASSTAIRKAYYKLALAHHPDKVTPAEI